MAYQPDKPYNDLPPLPPSTGIETTAILRKTIAAGRALAELKGALTKLPNPALFIDTIHLQEAQASSAIENIVTTEDELFRSSVAGRKSENPAVKEVLHYKDALRYGLDALEWRPVLSTNLFIRLVQIIRQNRAGIRNAPGNCLKNPVTGRVVYTPPEGEALIRDMLANLEFFIHAEDGMDPLVKMAVLHYQFEAIHPFFDGNGRAGRIILLLYLKFSGLLDLPALYLSGYIMEHKSAYYQKLQAVTAKNQWEDWVWFMLDMIEQTAGKDRRRISRIEQLMDAMGNEIQSRLPKLYSKDLMEVLFRLPYSKRQFLANAGLGNLKTVGNYLRDLEQAGYLVSEQVGKEKLYLNHRLLEILTSDAEK